MKTKHNNSSKNGGALVTAVIFLAIAAFSIGSIMNATGNYLGMNRVMHNHERAFLLADAGLTAALLDLADGGDGVISRVESQAYFFSTHRFSGSQWGFETSAEDLPGDVWGLSSSGSHLGRSAQCAVNVSESIGDDTIHPIYCTAVYAGNTSEDTNYEFSLGGTGGGADFVNGDIHINSDINVTGDADVWLPEGFTDLNGDGQWNVGEEWTESGVLGDFTNEPTVSNYNAYVEAVSNNVTYGNRRYDQGEAFIDNYGNGVFDSGEPFNDIDGDGVFSFGDTFTDQDGDGEYDPGEEFVDTGNGQYDEGEEFEDVNGNGVWDDATAGHYEGSGWGQTWVDGEPAEPYEDIGNGEYDAGESFVDRNGVYDPNTSDVFYDDRNGYYDYGTSATGTVSGAPSPGVGQIAPYENTDNIDPPNLQAMYYSVSKTAETPSGASDGWGNDVDVASQFSGSTKTIYDQDNPAHIFVKNPTSVSYDKIPGKDDYFLEDPTDPSYGASHQYITVKSNGNDKVYYVDGNVYIHNGSSYDFMFRDPGTKMTIIANGNITISDEFWYNGGTEDPQDMLAFIALKDPAVENSGNIYFGDSQFGTGGDVHAMLYAENNFVDNNLDTSGQPYLSVFGNMTAGNHVDIDREEPGRTRLDVTLDERIRRQEDLPPGLPPALSGQRTIYASEGWSRIAGTWSTPSRF